MVVNGTILGQIGPICAKHGKIDPNRPKWGKAKPSRVNRTKYDKKNPGRKTGSLNGKALFLISYF